MADECNGRILSSPYPDISPYPHNNYIPYILRGIYYLGPKRIYPTEYRRKNVISLTFDTLGYILWDIFPEQIDSYGSQYGVLKKCARLIVSGAWETF